MNKGCSVFRNRVDLDVFSKSDVCIEADVADRVEGEKVLIYVVVDVSEGAQGLLENISEVTVDQ
jgi:hypothetical protein